MTEKNANAQEPSLSDGTVPGDADLDSSRDGADKNGADKNGADKNAADKIDREERRD